MAHYSDGQVQNWIEQWTRSDPEFYRYDIELATDCLEARAERERLIDELGIDREQVPANELMNSGIERIKALCDEAIQLRAERDKLGAQVDSLAKQACSHFSAQVQAIIREMGLEPIGDTEAMRLIRAELARLRRELEEALDCTSDRLKCARQMETERDALKAEVKRLTNWVNATSAHNQALEAQLASAPRQLDVNETLFQNDGEPRLVQLGETVRNHEGDFETIMVGETVAKWQVVRRFEGPCEVPRLRRDGGESGEKI